MSIKILLPVDGSACALRAVDHLIAHLDWYREMPDIHLLHVHAPIPVGRVQAHVGKETLQAYYLEESQAHLAEAVQRLDAAACAYTRHVHVGQPAEVIAHQASVLACDLLLMGAHGRGALGGLLLGSVASRVLHLANIPVQLIK